MKRIHFFLVALILFVASSFASADTSQEWVRSNSQGSVSVDVKLMNPESMENDQVAEFVLYLTAHSGDLTKTKFSNLLAAEVNGVGLGVPVTWEWERKSAHHPVMKVSIDLRDVKMPISKLVLILRDIANVEERKFEWNFDVVATVSSAVPSSYYALVPNAADGTISVIDGGSLDVVDTVKVGDTASHGIAVSRDGKYIYSGDMEAGRVVILDTATRTRVAALEVGESAHGVDISPDGKFVLVAGDRITVLDTANNNIVASITDGLGESPSHVEFHPNGKYAYLTDPKDDKLRVISIPEFKVVASLIVGDGPNESRISPDGRLLYVANWEGNDIAVVNTDTLSVAHRIPAGEGTHGVAVSTNGKEVWTANRHTSDVSIIDTKTQSVIKSLLSGEYTNHLAFSPDGRRVFVTNARDNEVVVVDVTTLEIVGRVPTGQEPHEIDFVAQWTL